MIENNTSKGLTVDNCILKSFADISSGKKYTHNRQKYSKQLLNILYDSEKGCYNLENG